MGWLDHRIPPPLVLLAVAVVMSGSQWLWLGARAHGIVLYAGLLLCIGGFVLAFTGLRTLIGQRTTPSPTQIERAKTLVTSGLYRFTRNPMYLGMVIFLTGVAAIGGNYYLLLGPMFFALYIQRFQIVAEERVMLQKFGADYKAYQVRVRRWI